MRPQPTRQKRIILFIMSVALMGTLPLCIQFSALATRSTTVDATSSVQFNSATYMAGEGDGKVNITVTRSGSTTGAASVRYATGDGTAKEGRDYTAAFGALNFVAGETSKNFTVQIIDNSYAVGPRSVNLTLSNPSGADLSTPGTAVLTINDNDTVNGLNPVDQTQFFVQLHYYDFLSRYPDQAGWDFWTHNINSCTAQPSCTDAQRVNTSAAYFLSIEFQQTGYLVDRIYKAAYGSSAGTSTFGGTHQLAVPVVRFNEFLPDTQQIGQGLIVGQTGWEQVLENNKQGFAFGFVQRSRFTTAFPTSLTPSQFADQLFANAGVTPLAADRNAAMAEFGSVTNTSDTGARARALRDVAENSVLQQEEFNRAFVLMQYFGYLRRNPNDVPDSDYTGFDFWLTKLNQFNGDYNAAEMVKAFIVSTEYRSRFGPANATPSPTPTPTPSQGELTPDQRVAALGMVRANFESLLNSGLRRDEVNQQLLNFIRSRPEFSDAGISADSCVWATYTDGVGLIVANNRDPSTQAGSVSPRTASLSSRTSAVAEDFPGSTKARLIWGLGPAFDDPSPTLAGWLSEQNYQVILNEGATVDSLKSVGGDGVLFLEGHGGGVPYAVSTAEFVTLDSAKENPEGTGAYDDDLKKHRLVYMTAVWSHGLFGAREPESTYAFTSEFIRKYWGDFAPNSFVFSGACDGASAGASDFINAIQEKKASVYAGWTKSSSGNETAKFVFDRLLGGNHVYPEADGYKTRPFDYKSVDQDSQYHGVNPLTSANPIVNGSQLVFQELSDDSTDGFQSLAPSIKELQPDELNNTVLVYGEFGEDPGPNNRAVFVGGQKLQVKDQGWSPLTITCDLPKSGDGSAGDVVVTVNQHKSNVARLSEWQGTFTHTATGKGDLKQTSTYKVTFRADIRKVRNGIHTVPTFGFRRVLEATEDSTETYECDGKYSNPDGVTTEAWSGSGMLARETNPPQHLGFDVGGDMEDDRNFWLIFTAGPGRIVTFTFTDGRPPYSNPYDLLNPLLSDFPDGRIYFHLDENGNILGDTLTRADPNTGNLHTLKSSEMANGYPPNPNSAR